MGNRHLSWTGVIQQAGLRTGENVLSLDADAIEQRLERDPWVQSASVHRSLLSTVTIQVVERTPVAVVRRAGSFDLVAADGVAVSRSAGADGLPLLRRSGGTDHQAQAGPLSALATLDARTRGKVAMAWASEPSGIILRLRSGTRVTFGSATALREKAAALSSILSYAATRNDRLVALDLRSPAAPRARFSST
jgi:cell division protein FtsQ